MIGSVKERFCALEIHDATIIELVADQNGDGVWNLTLSLRTEDGLQKLSFHDCRSLRANIHGGLSRGDTIDKIGATTDSEVFRQADKWPSPLKKEALHYSITTNSGSVIDIVADSFEYKPAGDGLKR